MIPIARDTITIPISGVPLRWKGAYMKRFRRKEKMAPVAAPARSAIQMLTPAWLKK